MELKQTKKTPQKTTKQKKRPSRTVHPEKLNWSQYCWQYFHFSKAQHFLMEKNTGTASPAGLTWQLHRLPLWGKNSSSYFILH